MTEEDEEFNRIEREAAMRKEAVQDMPKIGCVNHDCDKCKASSDIKQDLTPVQEPDHGDELTIAYMSGLQRGKDFAAQRQWVGLTDEEIDELHGSPMSLEHSGELKWVRIIEAKLMEKNT